MTKDMSQDNTTQPGLGKFRIEANVQVATLDGVVIIEHKRTSIVRAKDAKELKKKMEHIWWNVIDESKDRAEEEFVDPAPVAVHPFTHGGEIPEPPPFNEDFPEPL